MKGNLDLAELRVFARVAELSHFSRAAEALGLPRGRVSQIVGSLEARLGTRLFQRTTRRVSLTADGEQLAERARALLADVGEIETLFQQDSQLSGRLRVDLPVRLAVDLVLPALPAFLAQHPRLSIDLSASDRRVDLVEEGFDGVLRVGPVHDDQLVARPLGQLAMVNVASPGYLAARGTPRRLDDLAAQGHELVGYSQSGSDRQARFEWQEGGAPRGLVLPARLTVNQTDTFKAAVLAGLGVAQLPRVGIEGHLAAGRLVRLLPDFEPAPLPVQFVWSQRRHQPRRVRVFMDWLAALLQTHLAPDNPAP